jgi:hypothetical protein
MRAVSYQISDTILLNTYLNQEMDMNRLISHFSLEHILGFGLAPGYIQPYSPDKIHNIHGIQAYFCSLSLSDLAMNKDQKILLWSALQKMFSIR